MLSRLALFRRRSFQVTGHIRFQSAAGFYLPSPRMWQAAVAFSLAGCLSLSLRLCDIDPQLRAERQSLGSIPFFSGNRRKIQLPCDYCAVSAAAGHWPSPAGVFPCHNNDRTYFSHLGLPLEAAQRVRWFSGGSFMCLWTYLAMVCIQLWNKIAGNDSVLNHSI